MDPGRARRTVAAIAPPLLAGAALALVAVSSAAAPPALIALLAGAVLAVVTPLVLVRPARSAAVAVLAGVISLAAAWFVARAAIRLGSLTGMETALSVSLASDGFDVGSLALAGMLLVAAAGIVPTVSVVAPAAFAAGAAGGRRRALAVGLHTARAGAPAVMLTAGLAVAGARLASLTVLTISSPRYGPRLVTLETANRQVVSMTGFMLIMATMAVLLAVLGSVLVAVVLTGATRGHERPTDGRPRAGRPRLAATCGVGLLLACWALAARWHGGLAATPERPTPNQWQLVQAQTVTGCSAARLHGGPDGPHVALEVLSGPARGTILEATAPPDGLDVANAAVLLRLRTETRRPAEGVIVGPVRTGWMLHLAFLVGIVTVVLLGVAGARALAALAATTITVSGGAAAIVDGGPGALVMVPVCLLAAVVLGLFASGVNREGLRIGLLATIGLAAVAGVAAGTLAAVGDEALTREPVATLRLLTRNAGVDYAAIVLGGWMLAVLGAVGAVACRAGRDADGNRANGRDCSEWHAPLIPLAGTLGALVAAVVLGCGGATVQECGRVGDASHVTETLYISIGHALAATVGMLVVVWVGRLGRRSMPSSAGP